MPPSDRALADERGLKVIDATCPLVTKVHLEAIRYARAATTCSTSGIVAIPEPIGTLGEIEADQGTLIETLAEADTVRVPDPERVVVLTQTTLSVQDTQAILARLRERFPKLELPPTEDIYATTNRQAAVSELSNEADLVLVARIEDQLQPRTGWSRRPARGREPTWCRAPRRSIRAGWRASRRWP